MKLNIEFLQTGGLPLTNDLMATLQDAFNVYEVLGDIAGDKTILKGCELIGSNVNPGIVAINGEILPFEGGLLASTVYIQTEEFSETFQDQLDKVLVRKRKVKFGNSAASLNWSDFVRLEVLKDIQVKVNNSATKQQFEQLAAEVEALKQKTAPIINGGIVWPWRKPVSEIPTGWKECIDFRGKTIVHYDPNDSDFANLNTNFGSKKHILTIDEMPRHSHGIAEYAGSPGMNGNHLSAPTNGGASPITLPTGGDQPHNNVQPSRIAMYIEPNFQ